jgi:diguanylate cyclase (GGDEF)-like protein
MQFFDSRLFDIAPIAMWFQDYSQLFSTFEHWRQQGVVDLAAYLQHDPKRIVSCFEQIYITQANAKALALFEVETLEQLNRLLQRGVENTPAYVEKLLFVWNKQTEFFSDVVHYTLSGQRLEIQKRSLVLPEYQHNFARVFVSMEDVTVYRALIQREAQQRQWAEILFHHSPIALFLYDLTQVNLGLAALEQQGLKLDPELAQQPLAVQQCLAKIELLQANQAALDLVEAADFAHLQQVLYPSLLQQDDTYAVFSQHILSVYQKRQPPSHENTIYTLKGKLRYILNQSMPFAAHAQQHLLQVAVTDITARKMAELNLTLLHQRDQLTGLYNRDFYMQELVRYQHLHLPEFSCLYVDINHLKPVNDSDGHFVGDQLLYRTGQLIQKLIQNQPYCAARVGGDEFVVLLPEVNDTHMQLQIAHLRHLLRLDNQQHPEQPLSLSIGGATQHDQESLDEMLKRADHAMLLDKTHYYHHYPEYKRRKSH